ncbi:MAG: hypothetical protein II932_09980 [Treponema sp.]|nr:hypothetical protein [Treponema sp.]
MGKNRYRLVAVAVSAAVLAVAGLATSVAAVSCGNRKKAGGENEISDLQQVSFVKKSHKWFYLSQEGFHETDLPQHAPQVLEQPWTEAIRIASAASLPAAFAGTDAGGSYTAYALVNRLGMLAFSGSDIELFSDTHYFSKLTADSLVFSDGQPVFYLYKSTFFNSANGSATAEPANAAAIGGGGGSSGTDDDGERPFLLDFNPRSGLFYPLVSYQNLGLSSDEEIIGFFWNGDSWTCASKRRREQQIEFKYFIWQPLMSLTDLNPALLSSDSFIFKHATEDDYKKINMPLLFASAPEQLKSLISSIPSEFSFYVSWRDGSGNSPVNYYQAGNNSSTLNAKGLAQSDAGYDVIVFADGTTYLRKTETGSIAAFRLPLLQAGYSYGEIAVSGDCLIVAWEENNFYKTKRSGFIQIDLSEVLKKI